MRKILATLFLWSFSIVYALAQITALPVIFTADQAVTFTYDATLSQGQALANLPVSVTTITAHIGAVTANAASTVWNVTPSTSVWGSPSATPKFTRQNSTSNIYTLTLPASGVRALFPTLVGTGTPIFRLAMVLRENGACGGFGGIATACKEGKTLTGQDIFLDINQGGLDIAFTLPTNNGFFVNTGETVNFTANTNISANITFEVNAVNGTTANNVTTSNGSVTVLSNVDKYIVKAKATAGAVNVEKTLYFVRRKATVGDDNFPTYAQYPTAINFPKIGLNYSPTNNREVTLVLRAPLKDKVYVVGDFNNWEIDPAYQMKRTILTAFPNNNDFYWVTFEVPVAGTEYAYQFAVYDALEASIRVADPYAQLILDPNDDQYLTTVYPNLKAYPSGKATGRVSVLQTNQTPYAWSAATTNFVKPIKENLVIYELWVYDFSPTRDFQGVIDKLDYLQGLGINTIELMPIMEYSGNISWGYNPRYFHAVDKAHGHKNKLKELIDKCHQRGIAVVLDMVLNHAEEDFPYVQMYPLNANPFFNAVATHPFSVFRDFNHDYALTKNLVKDINLFWIQEFKFDGFRFDLSKGFTQNAQCADKENIGCWNGYHADRVATWKRMADEVWAVDPTSYMILEHLSDNSEEAEMGNYRVNENPSKGMVFWRNMETNFAENVMGFNTGTANIAGSIWSNNATWQKPRLIPYMESHDEERIMYKALNNGNNTQANHNVRTVPIATDRVKAAAAMATLSAGPKMIWQFGEMGFDFSINSNGGRTSSKPFPWVAPQNYDTQPDRVKLRKAYGEIIKLKTTYNTFKSSDSFLETAQGGNQFFKQLKQTYQPYTTTPASGNEMNVVVIANFDVVAQNVTADFHHTGTWYDFFSGSIDAPYSVTNGTSKSINLKAGEFRIFTNFAIPAPEAELTTYALPAKATGVIAAGISDTQIKLDWTDASGIETGYRIERSATLNGTYTQTGSNLAAGAITFTDNGLAASTQYFYRIVTLSANGNKNSSVVNATTLAPVLPNAPTSLAATASTTALAINLAWTDANNETSYRIERKTGAGGTYAVIAPTVAINTTSYIDNTSLIAGTTYFYRVFSVLGSQSVASNEASAAAPNIVPLAPTSLVITAATTKAMNLTWIDNATNETAYSVARATTVGGTYTTLTSALPANSNSYTDSDASLVVGTQYFYRVCAVLGTQASCATSTASTVTAIENRLLEQSIAIYPNPTQNTIWVKFANNSGRQVVMRVLDLRGKELRTFPTTNAEIVELNLSTLPKGVYMLELSTDKGKATKRIVKN